MITEKISEISKTPNIHRQPKKNLPPINSSKEINVFSIKGKSVTGEKLQDEADERLKLISNHIISKSNNKIGKIKTIGFLGSLAAGIGVFAGAISACGPIAAGLLAVGTIGIGALLVTGIAEHFGGKNKRRASCSKYAAAIKDKQQIDISNAPEIKYDFVEKAGKVIFGIDNPTPLSENEIKAAAVEALGKDNTQTRDIYVYYPKSDGQTSEPVYIFDGKINSAVYNGFSQNGIEKNTYKIPAEYKNFVEKYLSSNEKIPQNQIDKLIQIAKALQTDGIYSKGQKNNKDDITEDVDIFDLSGDGYLNCGDICAANFQAIKNKLSPEIRNNLNDESNWNVNKLSQLLEISQFDCFTFFDLNGDDNINSEDFKLYNGLDNNIDKCDINADGKINKQDIELVTSYFKSFLKRYSNMSEFLENTKKIIGDENQMNVLKEYYENGDDKKILSLFE